MKKYIFLWSAEQGKLRANPIIESLSLKDDMRPKFSDTALLQFCIHTCIVVYFIEMINL